MLPTQAGEGPIPDTHLCHLVHHGSDSYWLAFARTANPHVDGQPGWPLDNAGLPAMLLRIKAPPSAIQEITKASIAVPANFDLIWDPAGYKVRSSYDRNASDLVD